MTNFSKCVFGFVTKALLDLDCYQIASVTLDYPFTNSQRSGESQNLGLDILGRLMVIPAERYSQLVQALATAHPIPGQSSL